MAISTKTRERTSKFAAVLKQAPQVTGRRTAPSANSEVVTIPWPSWRYWPWDLLRAFRWACFQHQGRPRILTEKVKHADLDRHGH